MSDRLCGYCRAPGHRKPDCTSFNEERKLVLTHTPQQRKRLIEAFGEVGLGIGALIRIEDYYSPERSLIGFVRDFDWVRFCSFMNAKHLKYSKRVKLDPLFVDKNYEFRSVHASVVAMGNGIAEERRIGIPISRLLKRKSQPNYHELENRNYMDPLRFTITDPSYDVEFNHETLTNSIVMPRRLLIGREQEHMKGYLPIEIK